VPLDQPIELCFDEAMDRASVRDWFAVAPWPGQLDCRWERDCFRCLPVAGWSADRTYTVLLGTKARDRRGNRLETPWLAAFATGDSLAGGFVAGEVRTGSISRDGVPVYLFEWPAAARPAPAPIPDPPPDPLQALRITQTDGEGRFLFHFVPAGRPLLAGALHDRRGNRAFDPAEDVWGWAEEPVDCAASGDTAAVLLYLVYPDDEGDLAGAVIDSSCVGYAPAARLTALADSLGAILSGERDAAGFPIAPEDTTARQRPTPAQEDSLRAQLARLEARRARSAADSARCSAPIWVAAYAAEGDSLPVAEVRSLGDFRVGALAPGIYRLEAYRDLDGDGRRGAGEPYGAFPLPVELKPGREIIGLTWTLESEGD